MLRRRAAAHHIGSVPIDFHAYRSDSERARRQTAHNRAGVRLVVQPQEIDGGQAVHVAVGASTEASNATGVNGNQADNSALTSGAVYVYR